MAEYKKTLNLPVTKFPMKADLVHKEPDTLKFWEEVDAFSLMQAASGLCQRPHPSGHGAE